MYPSVLIKYPVVSNDGVSKVVTIIVFRTRSVVVTGEKAYKYCNNVQNNDQFGIFS